jgi:hypothetical protein
MFQIKMGWAWQVTINGGDSWQQNPKWSGSSGAVSNFEFREGFGDSLAALTDDKFLSVALGTKPWMRLIRHNKRQWGPTQTFLCGYGACYFSLHCAFVVITMPLAPLLEKGISAEAYESSLDNPKGLTLFKENACIIVAKQYEIVFIPPGRLVNLWVYEEKPKEVPKTFAFGSSPVCHLPLKVPTSSVNLAARDFFKTWNDQVLEGKKGNLEMWQNRFDFWDSELKAV